ncbi:hypothetical protein [Neotabrizicola shimadae]|uniref:Uncharacterized protein n=1 Tax=Neotabrizicola shimadae TaxID=2807096 RepID=A0A8G1EF14_9RHOB|nr:hypothetical protein [Neotabrizicola shimadae]QYZ71369.1 hypothetical protein JO391_07690 [Neotabrizicola shimadae]
MPDRTFGQTFRQLALAMLNATLLLAVLLVFGTWLLIGRVQHFATDTAEAAATALGADLKGQMTGEVATLSATLENLSTLDARLSDVIAKAGTGDSAAVAQLTGLRTDVQTLTASVDKLNGTAKALRDNGGEVLTETLHGFLLELAERLGPLPAPTAPAN